MLSTFKRVLVGRPLESRSLSNQRLTKTVGLAVFSSDAVASSAFATQEILTILVPVLGAGAALGYLTPLSVVVVALLFIVVFSYRQTIAAYPNGGGSYIVSRENLGTAPGLVAGASLLVDYTLTVAVSIAAGTAAITSAIPELRGRAVLTAVVLLALLAVANLRGVRESGAVFAPPTYGYIVIMVVFLGVGLVRYISGDLAALPPSQGGVGGVGPLGAASLFLMMRAFSSGAIALSGVEAISNGVPAFKEPTSRNAATTLTWTGLVLAVLFSGVALLAERLKPGLSSNETILSIMGRAVFGAGSPLYFVLQFFTAAILVLSANTAFADFPRLSAVIAADGYMPRQLAHRGDRLVFSNGIIVLALAAGALLVAFNASVASLVPLFAVGLFASFTLSQAGMVQHHRRLREPRWQLGIVVNGIGAASTGVVLVVVLGSKFTSGAWVPAVVIPLVVAVFVMIRRHYVKVGLSLALQIDDVAEVVHHTVVVLAAAPTRATAHALAYARAMSPDHLVAVTVVGDDAEGTAAVAEWEVAGLEPALTVLDDPYRDLGDAVSGFLDRTDDEFVDDTVTVIIPEFVVSRWWEQALHNQSALVLKARLLHRPNTVVVSVPWLVDPAHRAVADRTGTHRI